MMNLPKGLILTCLTTIGIAFALPTSAGNSSIEITDAWARATSQRATTAAAYLTIINHGDETDILRSVITPIAKMAEPHESTIANGVASMRPIERMSIGRGQTITFKPGGSHIMLVGLGKPLKSGDRFPMTLMFERAGPIETEVLVRSIGPRSDEGAGQRDESTPEKRD